VGGPDLTFATAKLAELMFMPDGVTPACTILVERDPGGEGDTVVDVDPESPTYLQASRPNPDWAEIYDGPALVKAETQRASTASEGGAGVLLEPYLVTLPLPSPELLVGDRVTVVTNVRDPALVDKVLRVAEPLYFTFAVSRQARCEGRTNPEDRP